MRPKLICTTPKGVQLLRGDDAIPRVKTLRYQDVAPTGLEVGLTPARFPWMKTNTINMSPLHGLGVVCSAPHLRFQRGLCCAIYRAKWNSMRTW